MITSAYKGTNANLAAPDMKCELVHFEYKQNAGPDELERNLTALEMLQVLSDDQAAAAHARAAKQKPAPSSINISLKLAADDCARLFMDGNTARKPEAYESAGKAAMYRLIAKDPAQEDVVRLLTASPAKWSDLKTSATASDLAAKTQITDMSEAQRCFTPIYHIMEWTRHMSALAKCVQAFRSAAAGFNPESATYKKLHGALRDEAKNVSSLSEDYFKLPWAILAISQVLGFTPKVEVVYVSQPLKLTVTAPAAAPATVGAAE
jgi:hypothetical protein